MECVLCRWVNPEVSAVLVIYNDVFVLIPGMYSVQGPFPVPVVYLRLFIIFLKIIDITYDFDFL